MNKFNIALVVPFVVISTSNVGWAGKLGPEFQVNTYTLAAQDDPSVARLGDGGFVVTWASEGQDGSSTGVYGQRYDATGAPVGGEFQINKNTLSSQSSPSVAGLVDDGFVVTWSSDYQDGSDRGVYGQRYDAAGKRVGTREFKVNKTTIDDQEAPDVATLSDGGFVVTWQSYDQDGSYWNVYGQRYDAAGKRVGKREFRINKYTDSDQENPSVAGLGVGGFVVTWESAGQDGAYLGIYGQRYDAAGKRVGKREFRANRYTLGYQRDPSVAGTGDGGFIVTWASNGQDGSSYGVYGQRYDVAGKRVGRREFKVNKTTASTQSLPDVAGLGDGGFVVTWQSNGQDGSSNGVYGQRYNSAGKRVGNREFMVNTYTTNNQQEPSVADLTGGGFVAIWSSFGQDGSTDGIFGQRYSQ